MALRKLQAEIDKTLKGVSQGVEVFESTFDKLNHASNTTQKDKLENDLKNQIKKLQRMRDQIKAWLGSSDIKDKSTLFDNRKLIETQMERFKALEKEMKMKAFSKEGLIAQSRLDPAEKAKRDMVDWIGNTTDELSRQIEQTEAEAEQLQTAKKKKATGDRLGELDTLNERRQWHIGRLEVVQRMLENGQLQMDQVETIQEDVKFFVEANTEEDFDYDAGIYDDLNLQDEEDFTQEFSHNDDISNLDSASIADPMEAPKTPAKEDKERKLTPASKPATTPSEEQPPSPVLAKKQLSRKPTLEMKPEGISIPLPAAPAAPRLPAKPAELSSFTTLPTSKPTILPPIRYAAAAAAAVAGAQSIATVPTVPIPAPAPTIPSLAPPSAMTALSSPTNTKIDLAPGTAPQKEPSISEQEQSPASPLESSLAVSPSPELVEIPMPQANGHAPPPPPGIAPSRSPANQSTSQPALDRFMSASPIGNGLSPFEESSVNPTALGYAPHAESSRTGSAYSGHSPRLPQGVLGNLMQSFEVAKELSERRTGNVNESHAELDISYANAPHQSDAEPPHYYHPQNPVKTPSYYPQSKPSILDDKSIYQRLELDQLFYIFYYMVGTYEQWLAAQELKKQSWRFHKQYLTWFQRAHNPQAITEDYEQGGYYYFDWENSWCQRRKSDFRFEVSE
ncbi:MAG: proteinral negative regulator of transcription subunit 5 [Tremellales sp. Tagirdzhanova-0007]|nr:MAG: proteinral negative regulator of transcription subunit 5 [Tremellales sp. Tagirdzhanova-0007]